MKLFVWDFHGVLEKDNEYSVVEICNKVLEKFNVNKRISLEETKRLYGLKWGDYFRYCNPDAENDTIKEMVSYAVEVGLNEKNPLKYIKPMDNAHFVLKTIKERGHFNLVISNSSQESLKFFLDSVDITHLVDEYIGVDGHVEFSEENGKTAILKKYVEGNDFEKIIKIGDIEADIETGIECGAVTYLFSKERKNTKADYIISDLREVLKEI